MIMISRDDLPETPDWVPTPRDWNAALCCPAECDLCDDLRVPENIILGGDAD